MTITVVPIDSVAPAMYNPREVDPVRLELVKLSLRKLGFLSPVYVTADNEIVSGHQRTTAAQALGYTHIPVEVLDLPDLNQRKAVNILFNRATNDFESDKTSREVTELLNASPVWSLAEQLPDMPINSFPCVEAAEEDIAPYVRLNEGRWITYAKNVAASMLIHGVDMPVIVDDEGIVVNGIGRLELKAIKKQSKARIVHISSAKREFALAMMNWLSMDFAIDKHYADLLRHNSFRRPMQVRENLGRGFVFAMIGTKKAKEFDVTNPAHQRRWISFYGSTIVDFGAGQLTETNMLRAAGVTVNPFEPYFVAPGTREIDKGLSVELTRKFLSGVASGQQYDSVFLSSVLNSVPFYADRLHILKICAALCSPKTRVYAVSSSINQASYRVIKRGFLAGSNGVSIKTHLHYEDDISLGDLGNSPKVQKYHTPQTFYDLFKTAFQVVKADYDTSANVSAIATTPLPLSGLRAALEFEFNLPYPDGTRMGLVDEAIAAFKQRLGHVSD